MAKKKAANRRDGSPVQKGPETKKAQSEFEMVEVPISREFPAEQVGVLANHFVIQQDGPEFHLLFFQTHPPLILSESEEEIRQALKKVEARSVCVARLIVSAERLPSFIEAMQSNLDKYNRKQMAEAEAKEKETP
jgi:hypothetical protein